MAGGMGMVQAHGLDYSSECTLIRDKGTAMTHIRPAAVAGAFYPDNGDDLARMMEEMLAPWSLESSVEFP